MCAGESSFCKVDIGTGSCTLRSKISLEAGLCRRGELDRSLEGEGAVMELLCCCRTGDIGTDCAPTGREFVVGGCFGGEEGRAPGVAADVSEMKDEVSRVESLWPREFGCCAFCMAEPVSLRLPVLGSMSPATPSALRLCSTCRWSAGMSGEAEL